MKTFVFSAFFLITPCIFINSATWTRYYGGDGEEMGYCVAQDLDGFYIVAGYTTSYGAGNKDIYLLKIDSLGDTLWTRTYGSTGDDVAYDLEITDENDYVICGQINSNSCYVIKIDTGGSLIWQKTFPSFSKANSISKTFDNCFILAGGDWFFNNVDCFLLKINSSGDSLWSFIKVPLPEGYGFYAVEETVDSCYLVNEMSVIVNKFDCLGNHIDSFFIIAYNAQSKCPIIPLEDKGFIFTSMEDNFMVSPAHVIRCDSLGNIIWGGYPYIDKPYHNPLPDHIDHFTDITLKSNDNVITCGYQTNYDYLYDSYIFERRYNDGWQLWERSFGPGNALFSIAITNDNGYITCGYTDPWIEEINIVLIKTDSLGNDVVEEPITETKDQYKFSVNFNSTLNTFELNLREDVDLSLTVYDLNGRKLNTLYEGNLSAGLHSIYYTSRITGTFFFRMEVNDYSETGRFTVLR